jgi:hypothetical protein
VSGSTDVKLELVELLSGHKTLVLQQHRINIGLSRFTRAIAAPNDLRTCCCSMVPA